MDALEEMRNRLRQMNTQRSSTNNSELNSDTCPRCQNTGWEQYQKNGLLFVRECSCGIRQREISKSRLTFAEIPEIYKDARLDNFRTDIYGRDADNARAVVALKSAQYWLENLDSMINRGMGLYMCSGVKGSGKTRLAASIANELVHNRKIQAKFATSMQILSEIKASWDKTTDTNESTLINHLVTTKILIIDDFDTEQGDKPWIGDRFYQIVNTRYINKLPTIYTSNHTIESLRYEERIVNRVKERSFVVPFPEVSIRNLKARYNARELVGGIKNQNERA